MLFYRRKMCQIHQYVCSNTNCRYYTARRPGSTSHLWQWKPTSIAEIYIWLAIIVYIGINKQERLSDYWTEHPARPSHLITKYLTFRRFQQLLRHIRIFDIARFLKSKTVCIFERV